MIFFDMESCPACHALPNDIYIKSLASVHTLSHYIDMSLFQNLDADVAQQLMELF